MTHPTHSRRVARLAAIKRGWAADRKTEKQDELLLRRYDGEQYVVEAASDKALRIADEQQERLENYPVLDEEDWGEREHEAAQQVWRTC